MVVSNFISSMTAVVEVLVLISIALAIGFAMSMDTHSPYSLPQKLKKLETLFFDFALPLKGMNREPLTIPHLSPESHSSSARQNIGGSGALANKFIDRAVVVVWYLAVPTVGSKVSVLIEVLAIASNFVRVLRNAVDMVYVVVVIANVVLPVVSVLVELTEVTVSALELTRILMG